MVGAKVRDNAIPIAECAKKSMEQQQGFALPLVDIRKSFDGLKTKIHTVRCCTSTLVFVNLTMGCMLSLLSSITGQYTGFK
jgi:hypothetical protein